ncbi:MAG: gliding motility-associated C-terminal domain-containing protein, partial [Bacteroidales bacterium]|nr:gliding motility-associated C-terminal domain-containing protein [Bacteroidales bacterium]
TTPVLDPISDTAVCNVYTLEPISGLYLSGNQAYYSESGANGSVLTGNITNSQTVYIYDSNASCFSESSFEITVNSNLYPEIAGDTTFCKNDSLLLSVNGAYNTYLWSEGNPNNSLWVYEAGMYYLTVTDINNCQGVDSVLIFENALPVVEIVGDTSYCEGLSTFLGAGEAYQTYLWSNGMDQQQVELTQGFYYLTVMDDNHCYAYDSVEVVELARPVIKISGNSAICPEDTAFVQVVDVFPGFQWSTGDDSQGIATLNPDWYYVTVTDDNNCSSIDSVEVTVFDAINYAFDIQPASCPNSEDGAISIYNVSSPVTYTWSTGSNDSLLQNLLSGTYELTLTDAHHCVSNVQLELNSLDINCLNIPTAFSPNNDMVNDLWEIENIELKGQIKIEIFNRWGQLVFEFDGLGQEYAYSGNQWDGTYNGKELPVSAFVYMLYLEDEDKVINGVLSIKK